jgi:GAF domain-containing protein
LKNNALKTVLPMKGVMQPHTSVLEDRKRPDALKSYDIFDTSPEPGFDKLTRLAAQLCSAPCAAIVFVDGSRQFFKSRFGLADTETPDAPGFCTYAIGQTEIFVVEDATLDERFAAHPLVTGPAKLRFYAGMPLINADGQALGTLCVLDHKPSQLSRQQADTLRILRDEVMVELESRRTRGHLPQTRFSPDRALNARYKADEFLHSLVEGTVVSTGVDFLRELVRHAAAALGIRYAFVGYLLPGARIRPLAFWKGDGYLDAVEYSLDGTPCKKVIEGSACHYAQDVQRLFPNDAFLVELVVTSYLAVPLKASRGEIVGHLVAMDVAPMVLSPEEISVFKLFGERAGVEITRQMMEASLKKRDATLSAIFEGTASTVGSEFFRSLVKNLAAAVDVQYAFLTEFCVDRTKVRTLAFWTGTHFLDDFEYAIADTPCEKVLAGDLYHCVERVADQFPLHKKELDDLSVDSYLAIPVTNANGQVMGHLAVMDTKAMPLDQFDLSVFKIFGARAGAELQRVHLETAIKENEERMRALFDEAPVAYVHEGLDSKLLRVNRTGMKSLGITADQVKDLYGRDFIPQTPDAQKRFSAMWSGWRQRIRRY